MSAILPEGGADPQSLRIENVSLSYGATQVLKEVDLEIAPGELFAFLGPSGCGKTTLLRVIAGFGHADRGRILLGGQDIAHLPPWKRGVGLVFQSYALWPHMSVQQNVAFGLEERRLPRQDIRLRVERALALVGMGALADRRPAQLSGGQQQRVALARTLVVEPKLLLLDEPLSNLDAQMRVQVRRDLRAMQQRLGLTTIFVTHDQEEANSICDRIAVIREGTIQQVGTPVDLYERPANLFVARFLGTANVVDSERLTHDAAHAIAAPRASAPEPGLKLVFRPQDGTFQPLDGAGLSLSGVVVEREFLGSSVRYAVASEAGELLVEMPFHAGETLQDRDDRVTVSVPEAAIRWLSR